MTSDAKIGLLLGLVFIFVIAFVINGLPGLHHKDDSNKLTTNMVGLQNSPSGIGANERRVALDQQASSSGTAPTDARFTMPLSEGASVAGDTATANPAAQVEQPTAPQAPVAVSNPIAETQTHAAQVAPAAPASPATSRPAQAAPAVEKQPMKKQEPVKTTEQKTYVVESGDSLSSIAKKVYGEEEGNKLKNINALFEANHNTLSSPDLLIVGQKLTIPAIVPANTSSPATSAVLSGPAFTKVDSVGQRHQPAAADKPAPLVKSNQPSKSAGLYVVKEGDSLWQIAAAQLGDGNRYKEIVKLNSSLMASEDDLQIGMQLKMPPK